MGATVVAAAPRKRSESSYKAASHAVTACRASIHAEMAKLVVATRQCGSLPKARNLQSTWIARRDINIYFRKRTHIPDGIAAACAVELRAAPLDARPTFVCHTRSAVSAPSVSYLDGERATLCLSHRDELCRE